MWDGTTESGEYNYNYIGIGDSDAYNWLTFLDSDGDVTAVDGGSLYQTNYGDNGIAKVNAVPVPAAAWLLGSGLLGLVGIRRRCA
jgi:hypothetical protein